MVMLLMIVMVGLRKMRKYLSQYQPHIQESGSGDRVGDVVDDAAIKGR